MKMEMKQVKSGRKSIADGGEFVAHIKVGPEEEIVIEGYERAPTGTLGFFTCCLATFGFLAVVMRWRKDWQLKWTHSKCRLAEAEKLLVKERYQNKLVIYHVADVVELCQERGFQGEVSVHTGNGCFRHANRLRYFEFKNFRYIWDEKCEGFVQLFGIDTGLPFEYYHSQRGLTRDEQLKRQKAFGLNQITTPTQSILSLLIGQALSPFYVFQILSLVLWFCQDYVLFSSAIIIMSLYAIVETVIQTRRNQKALQKATRMSDSVTIIRHNGVQETIDSAQLVPGDVIEIPSTGGTMQCDAVILSGSCVAEESMLTGESVPVLKTSFNCLENEILDPKLHSHHLLFCGTKTIQSRKSSRVTAVVINTGNNTVKGGLIRLILFPPPVDFRFERDSYKFVAILSCLAGIGFIYTVVTKVMRGVPTTKIFFDAADLITIAVPPTLPLALTIGRMFALKRLKEKGIFCIMPRSIIISGSINCVCFDKTGTLTEDGLDIWGVLAKTEENGLQKPVNKVELIENGQLINGMATCHSLIKIGDDLKGDPMDLKIFTWTKWAFEETNETNQENSFSVVRPTKVNEYDSITILHQFPFLSNLQRMSVIVRHFYDNEFYVYCKGSPEMIARLCLPKTMPKGFDSTLDKYAKEGYRIIAMAWKRLEKFEPSNISRDQIETEMTFAGLIILENRLKPDTTTVIQNLESANIRTIMVTGDNLLTAINVAGKCKILKDGLRVITVECRQFEKDQLPEIYFEEHQMEVSKDSKNGLGYVNLAFDQNELNMQPKNYQFVLTGTAWSAIRTHYPHLVPKIITKGSVFARMSPEAKKDLIVELRNLGYYVVMCGDGANDCGALRAAHSGISLSGAESSVAATYTSTSTKISCVVQVIKEGRAALVTSFGIFKFMALYSIIQFFSCIILYYVDSNLTDMEFLYADLGLATLFILFFGRTESVNGPLAPNSPSNSLVSAAPVASLVLHSILTILMQIAAFLYIKVQPWHTPFIYNPKIHRLTDVKCEENFTVFVVSAFQYIIMAFVLSKGAPYRKAITENWGLLLSIIFNTFFVIWIALSPPPFLIHHLELVVPPNFEFRLGLMGFGLLNFFLAFVIEEIIADKFIHNRCRDPEKTKKKYLTIEKELQKDILWPTSRESIKNDNQITIENEKTHL